MTTAAVARRRNWLAPEVVQTSAMDCGPATLKCLLEGHGIAVSYGRLREACQTDLDGTSIDTIETVAGQLGLGVEQISIPLDHMLLDTAHALPAIVVTRQRDGSLHFVVVWRRHGQWLQVMDPSIGRRWVKSRAFLDEVYRHEQGVAASEWRAWAATDDHLAPLRERIQGIGAARRRSVRLVDQALADAGWLTLGALDAATRLVQSLIAAGGIRRGATAVNLVQALVERTCRTTASAATGEEAVDIYQSIPRHYWSVTPDPATTDADHPLLVLHGAVLVRVLGTDRHVARSIAQDAPLSPELTAALAEKPTRPLSAVFDMLRSDGFVPPLALIGAIVLAAGAILIETLLFRGLFDLAAMLTQPIQRLGAITALVAFAAVLLLMQVPIMNETARIGRQLEARLRMALLTKLPRLKDSYFNSRPVSDMAERSHSIQTTRNLPAMGLQFVQVLCEMIFTLTGIALIDPSSIGLAACIALLAIAISAAAQPFVNERELRVRSHAGALYGFYLDALLGLIPVRTHGAGKAVSRLHEGLLVEWVRSSTRLIRFSLVAGTLQGLLCTGLAAWLLVDHFVRAQGVSGADLLLVYWVLKLPAIGKSISALALAYPAQRNALLRLLEPLSAPEERPASHASEHAQGNARPDMQGTGIALHDVRVVAAGHVILQDITLNIAPGEHVAIVGRSGAGKSSLLGLLLGWQRPAKGEVRVDGESLDSAGIDRLRRHTAWIDPSVQLWNQPFVDNVRYAAESDAVDRIGDAVESARLRDVLQKLPDGLQHVLGEGGGLLSGGEGQRVRLARTLLQSDVRLALLDEPFRGMDRDSRSQLLAQVRGWWPHSTLICVTHDVGETMSFGRVLVIEDGRVVEDGVPVDLARRDSRYRHLLDAEAEVKQRSWAGRPWRRLRMLQGRIEEVR